MQFFAYQRVRDAVAEHKAKAGSVVVLDVQTGEVLALANYPSFDPGDRAQPLRRPAAQPRADRHLRARLDDEAVHRRAGRSRRGRVTPATAIQTAPGRMTITGSTIRDAHPHGVLTVAEVIQKSSNVGTVKMAMQMQPREMWELYSQVGFGQKPQIDFPGAVTRPAAPVQDLAADRAGDDELRLRPVGVAVPARARLHRVRARRRGDPDVDAQAPGRRAGRRARAVARDRARGARDAAHGHRPGGTAPKAQAIGYSVGGKTGTAHKQEGKGYASNKYRSWFVGIAPISNPRIVVAVMVDEPSNGMYYGGDVAAPVFSQVVQQTLRMLGVPPDIDVKPQIVANGMPASAGELLMRARARSHSNHPKRRSALAAQRAASPAPCAATAARCAPGDAFIAWPGYATDGRRFVAGRARRRRDARAWSKREGVEALRASSDARIATLPRLKAGDRPHRERASSTRRAQRSTCVAVTGTNGKTSTAWWTAQALDAARPALRRGRHAGHRRAAAATRRATSHSPASRRPTR